MLVTVTMKFSNPLRILVSSDAVGTGSRSQGQKERKTVGLPSGSKRARKPKWVGQAKGMQCRARGLKPDPGREGTPFPGKAPPGEGRVTGEGLLIPQGNRLWAAPLCRAAAPAGCFKVAEGKVIIVAAAEFEMQGRMALRSNNPS